MSVGYKMREAFMLGYGISEHREIIDEYAAQGYRYIDSIITEVDNSARVKQIDLVFEKDA